MLVSKLYDFDNKYHTHFIIFSKLYFDNISTYYIFVQNHIILDEDAVSKCFVIMNH